MKRRGDWIQTFKGVEFYPMDPRPEDVLLEDIYHALSLLCRFAGHCRDFYSVADHSIRVCDAVDTDDPHLKLQALMHDSAEAYVADLPRPLKINLPDYKDCEYVILKSIYKAFDIDMYIDDALIKHIDNVLIATEARDLMLNPSWLKNYPAPLPGKIIPRSIIESRHDFVNRFLKYHDQITKLKEEDSEVRN